MSIAISTAAPNQWPIVADITLNANQQYAAVADPDFWQQYERATRQMLLTDQDILRIVASEHGELLGSVIYCPPYDKELAGKRVVNLHPEMRLLSVLPQHRNRGIADALIQACEDKAADDQEDAITLHTTNLMTVAKAMYERRGYSRFTDIDFEPAPGFTVMGYIKSLEQK